MSNATQSDRKAFKDYFDAQAANAIAAQLQSAYRGFDKKAFVKQATRDLAALEFAGRVSQFSDAMAATLPRSRQKALAIITKSLPAPLPDCESVTDGWLQWPMGQFIADHGLEHFDESIDAMIALTQRFSAEYAVRPFVEHYPQATFAKLTALTTHESPHVRRWCSEGVRPRLPWGKKLTALVANPEPIWPILEALKGDPELYVRRSVANNLNDIAKDHPLDVVRRCKQWARTNNEPRARLIKHGLRSLIKDGHPGALELIGFAPAKNIAVTLSASPKKAQIGSKVTLKTTLHSKARAAQSLLIDYAVHFMKKDGKTADKVFKWTTLELPGNETLEISKQHALKQTTIRALYPGEHRVELQINGVRVAETKFTLV